MLTSSSSLRPEATLHLRFLPGCRACGARHPLVIDPRADPARCVACGGAIPDLDDGRTVPAVLTGFGAGVGRALMAIGRFLHRVLDRSVE